MARRELEIRSRRPPWYGGAAYNGTLMPLSLWCFLLVFTIGQGSEHSPSTLGHYAFPYAMYLALAASMMTAGSIAADADCARHLRVSAWSLLTGKMLGSLLPLVLEVLCLAVLLGAASAIFPKSGLGVRPIVELLLVLAGCIVLGALVGPAAVDPAEAPSVAASRARTWVWLYFILLPLLLYTDLPGEGISCQPLLTRVVLAIGLLHPFTALDMLATRPYPVDLVPAVTLLALMGLGLLAVGLSRIRSLMR